MGAAPGGSRRSPPSYRPRTGSARARLSRSCVPARSPRSGSSRARPSRSPSRPRGTAAGRAGGSATQAEMRRFPQRAAPPRRGSAGRPTSCETGDSHVNVARRRVARMNPEFTIPELTEVVARLSALLGPREGSVVQLDGGITNRNFKVNFGGMDYVVRLPGKRTTLLGIDRAAECIANKAGAELGIAPRVATLLEKPSCLVTAFIAGREMTQEELQRPEAILEVADALRRLHDSGTELPNRFDPFRLVEEYADTGRANDSEPPDGYDEALEAAKAIERAVRDQPEHEPVPAHNDLLPANFLHDGQRMQIIDWEYAGMGDRWFDLGNFAANNQLAED